jgi:hypothetical protein
MHSANHSRKSATMRHTGAVVFVLAVSAVRSTIAALLDLDALAIVTRELVASALGLCNKQFNIIKEGGFCAATGLIRPVPSTELYSGSSALFISVIYMKVFLMN